MNIRNEPLAQNLIGPMAGLLAVAMILPARGQAQEESASSSRFSDQPAPLMKEGFPERPPPLIEWGDKLLGSGNLQHGFTLPTGANWSPSLWVYGDYRSALQTFNPGNAPTISEWANRLDLYANLQLTGTERVLLGFRPIDQVQDGVPRYSGYSFEPAYPEKYHGWQNETRNRPPIPFSLKASLERFSPNWPRATGTIWTTAFPSGGNRCFCRTACWSTMTR